MAANYIELLRHPFWQRKRLEIFQRDDFTCRKCMDKISNLQVHHVYYQPNKMPWDYPNEALITLCEVCHAKAEFSKWMLTKGQAAFVRLGLEYNDRREVMQMILDKVKENHYKQEVFQYMDDIKNILLTDGKTH